MLQRLFSRHASDDRVEDAVSHSTSTEERDALRERSAVILGRLERRQAEVQRLEQAEKQAAREAAERAARDAQAAGTIEEAETVAPEATAAAYDTEHEANEVPADDQYATGHADPAAYASVADNETEADFHDDTVEDAPPGLGSYAAPEGDFAAQGYFSDSAPLREEEPVEIAPDDMEPHDSALHDEMASPADDFGYADEPEAPAASAQPERPLAENLSPEDAAMYDQIRQKAEEARLRIARRLEQMKADEETGQQEFETGRFDLGEHTPPLAPDLHED